MMSGRSRQGGRPRRPLTPEQVERVRSLHQARRSLRSIANVVGLSRRKVRAVVYPLVVTPLDDAVDDESGQVPRPNPHDGIPKDVSDELESWVPSRHRRDGELGKVETETLFRDRLKRYLGWFRVAARDPLSADIEKLTASSAAKIISSPVSQEDPVEQLLRIASQDWTLWDVMKMLNESRLLDAMKNAKEQSRKTTEAT